MDTESKVEQSSLTLNEIITPMVNNLFSFDDSNRTYIINEFYSTNVSYSSPIVRTVGSDNIKQVFLVWKAFNKKPPTIESVCYNGSTCIIFLVQHLCPRFFPFIQINLPVTVQLELKEVENGSLKIQSHKEYWTIQDLIKMIPGFSILYDQLIRMMMGKLLSLTGEIVHTATETAQLLLLRSKEIENKRNMLLDHPKLSQMLPIENK